MKILRQIIIIFVVFMGLALASFLILRNNVKFVERDLIHYNELLHLVEKDIASGVSEETIEKCYGCDVVLSKEIHDPELAEYYRHDALILDLTVNGEYAGKVVWNDQMNSFNKTNIMFLVQALILWGTILVVGIIIFVYIYLNLIKPINEMRSFSEQLAKGDLDTPLPLHKNNLFGSFVEGFDIMREQLKASRQREMEAENARKELVTALSHDIKTPLAVIKAACEMMEVKAEIKQEKLNAEVADGSITESRKEEEEKDIKNTLEKVGTISQKADTISALMSNVMHATLEDMEKLEVKPIETSSKVVMDIMQSYSHYGNILIENEIPGALVYMDRIRMEQAIDNVIGNSLKYAGTDIHISFSETPDILTEDGKKLRFIRMEIKDDGPGAKEEDLPLLTEKYYRGKNATEQNGYGLGLFLVKHYMDKMLGGMEYYNNNGFTVVLMLRKV